MTNPRIRDNRDLARIDRWQRLELLIARLSGDEQRWVGPEEIAELACQEQVLRAWLLDMAIANGDGVRDQADVLVSQWWELERGGHFARSDFEIESGFDGSNAIWRVRHRPSTATTDSLEPVIERLVADHGGRLESEVAGRVQISVPACEVFVSRITEPDLTATTLLERPLALHALVGVELDPAGRFEPELEAFLADPMTPAEVGITIEAAIGTQVWLDQVHPEAVLIGPALDAAIAEFITLAEALVGRLEPFERHR